MEAETFSDTKVLLEISQKWFLSDGSEPEPPQVWTVPLKVSTGGDVSLHMFRGEATDKLSVEVALTQPWVKLNAGQACPLRVA